MKRIIFAITALALSLFLIASSSGDNDNTIPMETEATVYGYDIAILYAFFPHPGIPATFEGFCWGLSETEMDNKTMNTEYYSNDIYSAKLTDLKPNTKYWYKAVVKIGGKAYYGEIRNFTTEEFEMVAVDMGLSVKWSNANLGALMPEDYGDYFAWGETETKADYSSATYKWGNYGYDKERGYYGDEKYDYNNKRRLDLSDDAAHVLLGGSWRMPTSREWDELKDEHNCTWTWSSRNGIRGYIVTSKKTGNSIFLPAAGRLGDSWNSIGSYGFYWASELNYGGGAGDFYFCSSKIFGGSSCGRSCGQSVRPVTK